MDGAEGRFGWSPSQSDTRSKARWIPGSVSVTSQEISLPLLSTETPQLHQNFVKINNVKLLDFGTNRLQKKQTKVSAKRAFSWHPWYQDDCLVEPCSCDRLGIKLPEPEADYSIYCRGAEWYWDLAWLRSLIPGLSKRRPGFDLRSVHVRWNSWWAKWRWNWFMSEYFGPPTPINIVPAMFHTHLFTYHRRCVNSTTANDVK